MAFFYQKIKTINDTGVILEVGVNNCRGTTPQSAGNWGTDPQTPLLTVKKTDNTNVSLGYLITSHMYMGYMVNVFQFAQNIGIGQDSSVIDYFTSAGAGVSRFLKTQNVVFQRDFSILHGTDINTATSAMRHFLTSDAANTVYPGVTLKGDIFDTSSGKAEGIHIYAVKSGANNYYGNVRISGGLSSTDETAGSSIQLNQGALKARSSGKILMSSYQSVSTAPTLHDNAMGFFLNVSNSELGFGLRGTSYTDALVYSNIPIHAPYFNATSDARAKTDISKATFSARDVVKTLPIYSYILKENSERMIGIVAQDALNLKLDGFELIKNKEATGKDGDYMAVKESKLVYVAWKAIQEQEEIIEKQQKEIDELKDLVRQLLKEKK